MVRKLTILLLTLAVIAFAADPSQFKVMTQNMDASTDLTFAVAELYGVFPAKVGVELTYQEILASDMHGRTLLLAGKIAQARPEFIGLQEATLWRTGDTVATATNVVADQLALLLADLAAANTPYDVVAINSLGDLALPKASGGVLRMTDRDVLLMRSDLRPPMFSVSDVHANRFDAVYSVQGVPVVSGWISAIVHTGNRIFRLLTTHLQGPVGPDPSAIEVQVAQGKQLLYEVRNSAIPVIIAGDFNSDMMPNPQGPDNTSTFALFTAAGYTDTWAAAGSGPGVTWPYYAEDQYPPPFYVSAVPWERIDLIFSLGLTPVKSELVLAPGSGWPSFGSDHAGVMTSFQF